MSIQTVSSPLLQGARRLQAQQMEAELPEHRAGELLLRLQPGASFTADVVDLLGGEVLHRFDFPKTQLTEPGDMLHLKLPEGLTTAEAMVALESDPRVVYAAPNHIFHADESLAGKSAVPNDLDKQLWAMEKIHAPEAWAITHGSKTGPIIAVFDSGADFNHPDLKSNLWVNPGEIPGNGTDDDRNGYIDDVHGIFPQQNSGNIMDGVRHGTHTAGTIGASGNNGHGITGVNWEARVMPIKIFDDKGRTDAASVAKGMEYAAQHGATITSNSWGGDVFNPAILEAFKSFPALHICAAGNRHSNNDIKPQYPATFDLDNIISVASTDRNDKLANTSCYGLNTVDLAAPGVDILSTVPGGGYESLSGTSMATPHVTGVAGLIATAYPDASAEEIKNRLLYSTDKVDTLKGMVSTGGRLNAASALENDTISPNTPGKVSVKTADSRGITLQWIAPGDDGDRGTASMYEVRYSDKPITEENFSKATRVAVDAPKAGGSKEEVRINMRPDVKARNLYFGVKAYDNVGNHSALAGVAATLPAGRVAFEDKGESGFIRDGQWAQVTLPDAGKVWTDSPDGDYKDSQTTSLTTKPFSLKGIKNATVVFDAKTELDGSDRVWLQASTDGTNWKAMGSLMDSHPWESHQVDLSSFDGQKNLQFRFAMVADHQGHKDGIYLKNIAILGDTK